MKKSLRDHSGYLIIDHSNSPGLTESELPLRLKGTAVPKGKIGEWDIQNCSHCQRAILLNPDRIRARGYCAKCDHYICDSCDVILRKTGKCVPFKKIIDTVQNHSEDKIVITDS